MGNVTSFGWLGTVGTVVASELSGVRDGMLSPVGSDAPLSSPDRVVSRITPPMHPKITAAAMAKMMSFLLFTLLPPFRFQSKQNYFVFRRCSSSSATCLQAAGYAFVMAHRYCGTVLNSPDSVYTIAAQALQ